MAKNSLFEKDPYEEFDSKYFRQLRESGNIYADPSGWRDTITSVLSDNIFKPESQFYYSDFYNHLDSFKDKLVPLFSKWDKCKYTSENITLCHSATIGSLIALTYLKWQGIKTIIFETPYYFASYYQAKSLGFKTIRIPTFYSNKFKLDLSIAQMDKNEPYALFITQPRTALGVNQELDLVQSILENLGSKNFLIIDEATEQLFPSHLSQFNVNDHPRLIKIRSVFKPMGINGLRLAYLIHSPQIRRGIADEMEVMQGALDYNSLKVAFDLSHDPNRFESLLRLANSQVKSIHEKLSVTILGTNITLSPIDNGYIGSCAILLKSNDDKRALIRYCAEHKMPIIVGASMGFAKQDKIELIRLNYFNKAHHLSRALDMLSNF